MKQVRGSVQFSRMRRQKDATVLSSFRRRHDDPIGSLLIIERRVL